MSCNAYKEHKLFDICNFCTGKLNSNAATVNGKYPFFTCSPQTLQIDEYAFDCEALLLAGNNAEGKFSIKYYNGKFNAYQRTYVITPKDFGRVDLKYVYYSLSLMLNKFRELSIGTATKFLTMGILNAFKIPLPRIEKQRAIAAILSSLDDKIELNNRINKTMEEMGQALFKRWFVDFEFPDENGQPYKSSGGEMAESELGLIPKKWKIIRLSDLCHVLSGGTPKTGVAEYWNGVIPFFSPKDAIDGFYTLYTEKTITDEGLKKCNSKLYPKDTVFITARGTVGKVVLSGRDMAMNQSCYALQGRDGVGQYFLFFQTLRAIDQLKKSASGAVFDAIVVKSFDSIKVVMPPSCIVGDFCDLVSSSFSNIFINTEQSNALVSIRDTLLPKLMSGEIRVPIEEVAADV